MLVSIRRPGDSYPFLLAVSDQGRWAEPDAGSPVELGTDRWAVAGLVDAHSHLAADELELEAGEPEEIRGRTFACLDRGTFLVVDKGWCDTSVVATLTGMPPTERPDFEAAGRMIAVPGGYYPDCAVETDAAGLAGVVSRAVADGRGWVKLVGDWPRPGRGAVANFDAAMLTTAVDVAHAGGARVAIHTMAPEVPSMAVAAGVDSIEHGLFLTEDDVAVLAGRGGAWVPTVLRMEAIVRMLGRDSSGGRLIRDGLDNVSALLRRVPAGVSVLAGTDLATDPGDVGREVVGLVEHGLEPGRALAAATVTARSYLGRRPGFEVGEPADAVFFERDPLDDPGVLNEPREVLWAGERRR